MTTPSGILCRWFIQEAMRREEIQEAMRGEDIQEAMRRK
jgi:hypothetical protein